MKRVSFRVRKIYFDKIMKGEKTEEIRSNTPFWRVRLLGSYTGDPLFFHPPEVAVFVCGRAVHRRRIRRVFIDVPEKYLDRDLSLQGIGDISTDSAIIVELGEAVP